MASISEIPLTPEAQRMSVTLAGVPYRLTFRYRDADGAGWIVDIADAIDTPILCGVPLVTGADLLAQYLHLAFGGALGVLTDGDDSAPTFEGLGTASHVVWVTDA